MGDLTVLLVEDDPSQALFVRELLAGTADTAPRFAVAPVARLDDALACVGGGDIDVILLDLTLPHEQGLTGVKRLHAAAPRVPIVVLGAGADEPLAIKGVREGARDYLIKGQVDGELLARTLLHAVERQRVENDLADLAYHDPLTRLPNHTLFTDRLAYALAQAGRYGQRVGLLLLDLDGFGGINDALGHETGDDLLREVARRLARCTRESDTVARLAGDEFAAILPDIGTAADAAVVARKIVAAVGKGPALRGRAAAVTASVGIALYPADGHDVGSLIAAADAALCRAKHGGKDGYAFASNPEPEPKLEGRWDEHGKIIALPVKTVGQTPIVTRRPEE